MDIYLDKIKHSSFANHKKVKGKIYNRLVGINVVTKGKQTILEPIYMAAMQFEKIGKVLIVNINTDKPWLTIIFLPQWPFVVFMEEGSIVLEDE